MFESNYSGDENFIPKSMQQKAFKDASKSLNHPIHITTGNNWWTETDDDLFIGNTDKEIKKDALIKRSMPKIEKPKEIDNDPTEGFGVEFQRIRKRGRVHHYLLFIDMYIKYYENLLIKNIDELSVKETYNLKLLKQKKQELDDYLEKLNNCPIEDLIGSGLFSVLISLRELRAHMWSKRVDFVLENASITTTSK